jgi:hypothetical protein
VDISYDQSPRWQKLAAVPEEARGAEKAHSDWRAVNSDRQRCCRVAGVACRLALDACKKNIPAISVIAIDTPA